MKTIKVEQSTSIGVKGEKNICKMLVRLFRLRLVISIFVGVFLTIFGVKTLYIKYSTRLDAEYSGEAYLQDGRRLERDQPGYFMKGKYPVLNSTFCKFNYGLPDTLDWNKLSVLGTPQLGKKSPYRIIYNVIERSMFDSSYVLDQVTYATHVTPEFLYHIVEIARFWDGPISVTAFVPNYDMEITMKLFVQLCRCFDGMSKVSVHLAYPRTDPPILLHNSKNNVTNTTLNDSKAQRFPSEKIIKSIDAIFDNEDVVQVNGSRHKKRPAKSERKLYNYKHFINIDFTDCSIPDLNGVRTFRARHGLVYPVNVARNVARNASSTQYNLVSDVELIPSDGLATKFSGMVQDQKISGENGALQKMRLVFVIPVFEVEQGEDVPRNKSSLQQLYAEGKAVYFHRWVCGHCQKIPDLQAWLKDDPGNIIKPFSVTKRQFPYHRWEPIYIANKNTPWYSETLSWEGRQDKMTQMLEMCLKSYDFVIVDGAFLCHSPGIKSKTKSKTWRYRHELVNTRQYDLIVKSLAERYPANPKCRLG